MIIEQVKTDTPKNGERCRFGFKARLFYIRKIYMEKFKEIYLHHFNNIYGYIFLIKYKQEDPRYDVMRNMLLSQLVSVYHAARIAFKEYAVPKDILTEPREGFLPFWDTPFRFNVWSFVPRDEAPEDAREVIDYYFPEWKEEAEEWASES